MKKLLIALACSIALIGAVDAKPGGGGGGGGGHASSGGGGHSVSSSGSSGKGSFSAPAASPSNKGSFSAPAQRSTTTTSTTSVTRSSSGTSYRYNSPYVGGGMMYGGWGMGYGYTNGLLTGLIIGNMMHPHGSVMYTGGGTYNNNALLYPDGRVVDQSGRVVGTYVNGQFTPIQNGQIVAQPVPADAGAQPMQQAQPIIINTGPTAMEIVGMIFLGIGCVLLFLFIIGGL